MDDDDYNTNRSLLMPSFLPAIKLGSKNARRMLFDIEDINLVHNRSVIEDSKDTDNLGDAPYVAKRLNMSMTTQNGRKLTCPVPNTKRFKLKSRKDSNEIIEEERNFSSRRSNGNQRSNTSDRLVDYQNNVNKQFDKMSMHEQFNLDILSNLPSWGEAGNTSGNKLKPGTTKYASTVNKHSLIDDLLITKRRALNHKRRDFWNQRLSDNIHLPPPPLGKSLGHGILKLSKHKGHNYSTLNVSVVSK
jgi:hypothetical protein